MKTLTGAGLRARRDAAGMTQQQLADAIHISRVAVAMWETGRALPSAALLPQIAAALGCSIDELYEGGGHEAL